MSTGRLARQIIVQVGPTGIQRRETTKMVRAVGYPVTLDPLAADVRLVVSRDVGHLGGYKIAAFKLRGGIVERGWPGSEKLALTAEDRQPRVAELLSHMTLVHSGTVVWQMPKGPAPADAVEVRGDHYLATALAEYLRAAGWSISQQAYNIIEIGPDPSGPGYFVQISSRTGDIRRGHTLGASGIGFMVADLLDRWTAEADPERPTRAFFVDADNHIDSLLYGLEAPGWTPTNESWLARARFRAGPMSDVTQGFELSVVDMPTGFHRLVTTPQMSGLAPAAIHLLGEIDAVEARAGGTDSSNDPTNADGGPVETISTAWRSGPLTPEEEHSVRSLAEILRQALTNYELASRDARDPLVDATAHLIRALVAFTSGGNHLKGSLIWPVIAELQQEFGELMLELGDAGALAVTEMDMPELAAGIQEALHHEVEHVEEAVEHSKVPEPPTPANDPLADRLDRVLGIMETQAETSGKQADALAELARRAGHAPNQPKHRRRVGKGTVLVSLTIGTAGSVVGNTVTNGWLWHAVEHLINLLPGIR